MSYAFLNTISRVFFLFSPVCDSIGLLKERRIDMREPWRLCGRIPGTHVADQYAHFPQTQHTRWISMTTRSESNFLKTSRILVSSACIVSATRLRGSVSTDGLFFFTSRGSRFLEYFIFGMEGKALRVFQVVTTAALSPHSLLVHARSKPISYLYGRAILISVRHAS